MQDPEQLPTVSVVIAAFADERWSDLQAAVSSVLMQTVPALEIVVVIDHNPNLLELAARELTGATVVANTSVKGASGARNTGAALCQGDIIAFLDDDAVASTTWLQHLLRPFADLRVVGSGGRLDPLWSRANAPRWFPPEFYWVIGASYRGMPEVAAPVRNVWTGNMAIRRSVFEHIGGFRIGFGKLGNRPQPEDTELCIRAGQITTDATWIYVPEALCEHRVPEKRAHFRFFVKRTYHQGREKADLAALAGSTATSTERSYAARVLPRGVALGLREAMVGDANGIARSMAIIIGLLATITGYIVGSGMRRRATAGPAEVLSAPGEFAAYRLLDIELTSPLPKLLHDALRPRVWALIRANTQPLGVVVLDVPFGGMAPGHLADAVWARLGQEIVACAVAAGLDPPTGLDESGLPIAPSASPYLRSRARLLSVAPSISVVICTRDRADRVAVLLRALERQDHPDFEIVVVDNAPTTDVVREIVAAHKGRVPCRYAKEPRPGLSWARNAGIAAASAEILAFIDDDEEPDAHWLSEISRGFTVAPDVGCVSGMILPKRLDTQEQEWFEQLGGHSMGRGFVRDSFTRGGAQSPLLPLPPFGAGGNMAFRREALTRIGGFDVALGAGTAASGGEDTLAITLVLLAGYRVAYEPGAFVRHDHYDDLIGLGRQLRGYGVGLTAFYAALVRHRPTVVLRLIRLLPTAWRALRAADVDRSVASPTFPAELMRRRRRGMLVGPIAYARSVREQRRITERGRLR
jgi:glycosyltransferase involved in cell wall biosynthesis